MKTKLIAGLAALLIMMASAATSQAQESQAQNSQDQDQAELGVARISLIHGDVSTQRGDSGDWTAAALNAPVVSGDRISTGDNSRTEVQLDFANILRLAEHAQANITGLTRTQIQVELGQGLANYSVFKNSEADVEIDTPNASIHPNRGDGSFRILVVSQDETQILARKGDADISTPQGSTHLRKGQLITVRGTDNDTQYQVSDAFSKDDWDRWNSDRDNTIRNAQAWRNTNAYYVGSEDLDAHGSWRDVPDYGPVWVPTVNYSWAPYRDGRWVWEPYWGWTWVSYEPWGWAPYHYGRWFMYGSSWVWWPGPAYRQGFYRPVWAPAYVSFFGFGHGVGVGISFGGGWGSVGWLPIGPCDGFNPWWGRHRDRFNVVNVTNITNVYNIHNGGMPPLRTGTRYSNLRLAVTNDRIRGAVSTVPANNFGRGHFKPQPVSREMFRDGKVVAGNLPVVPTRESLRVSDRAAAPSTIRGGQPQRFFTKNRPVGRAQSFDRDAAQVHSAIQRDGHFQPIIGNPRSTASETNPRGVPQVRTNETPVTKGGVRQPGNPNPNPGWRRMGTPDQQPAPRITPTTTGPGQRRSTAGETENWKPAPNGGSPSSLPNTGVPNNGTPSGRQPAGRVNTPGGTIPLKENPSWRRFDRPAEPAPSGAGSPKGSSGSPAPAPARPDRFQREDPAPTQNRGTGWQRPSAPPNSAPAQPVNRTDQNDSWRRPAGGSTPAPQAQRDNGNSRQPAGRSVREEPRPTRPPIEMKQPVVTPPSSRPVPSSGGSHGNSSGGGKSAPSRGGEQHSSGGDSKSQRGR